MPRVVRERSKIRQRGHMHPRRTAVPLLLAALLITTGCVSLPQAPTPAPSARPADLAPAAVRPPAPVADWPVPRQAAPREALESTEPERKQNRSVPPRRPVHADPSQRRQTTPQRRHAKPAPAPKKKRKSTPKRTPQQNPGMRSLCRQAHGVVSPDIVGLCRDTYGR
ncbi:hypothetical protein [Streptomyces sp. NPDC056527]|uniref:hypothetical protein n=1 Tax=Streptomyces sp. NPDC056527 TaxID=3345853 RepID=UPI0036BC8A0C